MYKFITCCHKYTILSIALEGLQKFAHACMIKVGKLALTGGLVCLIFEACGGKIAKKNIGATRWLAANLLQDIPNCQVYRVCNFIAKLGEQSLVGEDDKRDYSGTRFVFFEHFLKYESCEPRNEHVGNECLSI